MVSSSVLSQSGSGVYFACCIHDSNLFRIRKDRADHFELLLDRKLTRDSVRRGLDSLPPDYRQILLLREIQGLSYDEIAQALSLEVGTVKSRIFRARKRLCTFLIDDGNISDFSSSGKMKGGESQ